MIAISADERAPVPRPIVLTLSCDAHGGDLFGTAPASFEHPSGFIGAYALAMKAGWKDTSREGRRFFLGPCCSGKATDDVDQT